MDYLRRQSHLAAFAHRGGLSLTMDLLDVPPIILPKGIVVNTTDVYAEVASFPVIPVENIRRYWHGKSAGCHTPIPWITTSADFRLVPLV